MFARGSVAGPAGPYITYVPTLLLPPKGQDGEFIFLPIFVFRLGTGYRQLYNQNFKMFFLRSCVFGRI